MEPSVEGYWQSEFPDRPSSEMVGDGKQKRTSVSCNLSHPRLSELLAGAAANLGECSLDRDGGGSRYSQTNTAIPDLRPKSRLEPREMSVSLVESVQSGVEKKNVRRLAARLTKDDETQSMG